MKVILHHKDKPLLVLGDSLNLFEYDNNMNKHLHTDDLAKSMISNSLFPLVISKAPNFFIPSSTLIDHTWTSILNNSTKCDVVDILTILVAANHY